MASRIEEWLIRGVRSVWICLALAARDGGFQLLRDGVRHSIANEGEYVWILHNGTRLNLEDAADLVFVMLLHEARKVTKSEGIRIPDLMFQKVS